MVIVRRLPLLARALLCAAALVCGIGMALLAFFMRRPPPALTLPATGAALVFYFVYVLASTYAVDFMSQKLFGNVNVGLLIGLGQFVTTFVITGLYVRFANRELDPRAAAIRAELEGAQR